MLFRSLSVLPDTAPWTHTGTYLGETGLMLGTSRLYFRPGRFLHGIQLITVNGETVAIDKLPSYPFTLFTERMFSVVMTSTHVISVKTPLLSFDLVNSDGFFNVDNARLSASATTTDTAILEGILGQSADATRYFPAYVPARDGIAEKWTSIMKDDFQQHQQMDYLLDETTREGLFSTHFNNNLFEEIAIQ